MLHKPKLLRNEWNISVLIFTVASVMLEMFIQHGLGLGATFLGGIMLHVSCLVFVFLAAIFKSIKRNYIFLSFLLLANEMCASYYGMKILDYNSLLRIHSFVGFAMMIMVVLGIDWTSSIKKSDADSIFFLIFICGVFSCLYSMTAQFSLFRQYFTGADVGWEYTSFLGHRNQYAGFLYISTVAGLYLWQNSRKIIYPNTHCNLLSEHSRN